MCSHSREVKLHVPDGTSDFYWLLSQTRGPCPLKSVIVTYTSSILCFFPPNTSSAWIKCLWKTAGGLWPVLQTIKSVLLWQPWDLFSQEQTTEVFVCIVLRTQCVSCSSTLFKPVYIRMYKPNIVLTPSRVKAARWIGLKQLWLLSIFYLFNISVYLLELSLWETIFNIFYIFSGSVKEGLVNLIDQLENLSTILTVLGRYEIHFIFPKLHIFNFNFSGFCFNSLIKFQ